jgi:sigma-E factor negative regulatory protein RseA
MTTDRPDGADEARWLISALADGELDAAECSRALAAWAESGSGARRSWHTYHLVGDVLRSEDLCSAPGHDQAFLERLRSRLAEEPAVPVIAVAAPQPSAGVHPARRQRWVMPMALAAGVMALASMLVLKLGPGDGATSSAPVLAVAPAAVVTVAAAGNVPLAPVLETSAQGSRIVRDAQLDRYLRAHRDYGAALPGSLPGGSGRSIVTVSLDR